MDTTELRHRTAAKAYSAYHLNASYDLLECTYDDLIIQGEAKKDENDAFCQLVDRYNKKKAIFIADRGYNHIAKEILPIRPRRSNLKVSDSLTIGMTNISYYSLYLV